MAKFVRYLLTFYEYFDLEEFYERNEIESQVLFPERGYPVEVFPAPPPDPDIPGTALVTRFFVFRKGTFFVFLPFIFGFCMIFDQVGRVSLT